jgi:hypothetical protein
MPGSEVCRDACWRWPWSRTRTWWGSAGQSHCTGNGKNGTHKWYLCTGNRQTVLTSGISVLETDKRYSQAVSLYRKRTNGTQKRYLYTGIGQTVLTSGLSVSQTDNRYSQSVTSIPETDKRCSQAVSLYRKRTNVTHKRAHCTGSGQTQVRLNLPETDERNHQTVTLVFRKLWFYTVTL